MRRGGANSAPASRFPIRNDPDTIDLSPVALTGAVHRGVEGLGRSRATRTLAPREGERQVERTWDRRRADIGSQRQDAGTEEAAAVGLVPLSRMRTDRSDHRRWAMQGVRGDIPGAGPGKRRRPAAKTVWKPFGRELSLRNGAASGAERPWGLWFTGAGSGSNGPGGTASWSACRSSASATDASL